MQAIGAVVLILLLTPTAHAGAWYLMSADAKLVSNSSVADRLLKGPVLGPLELISQGEFSSREDCEPSRDQLIAAWRKQGLMIRAAGISMASGGPASSSAAFPTLIRT